MRTSNRSIYRMTSAFLAVAVMILASFTMVSSDSEAAPGGTDPSFVSGLSLTIYDENTTDYRSLAYLSDKLPDTLNATKWVRNAGDGFWYNVDQNDPKHGRILTYNDLTPAMANEEIRTDILERYNSVFTGDEFVIMQVSFTVMKQCNVSYSITKDGTEQTSYLPHEINTQVGAYVCRSIGFMQQYTVDPSLSADIHPSDIRGDYVVELKCNGESIGTDSETYGGGSLRATGTVADAFGHGIPDATITYAVNNGVTSTVRTDSTGKYTIYVGSGSNVKIMGVSAYGYSFVSVLLPMYSGTMTGNYTFTNIVSVEKTVQVHVEDRSHHPAADVRIGAIWYVQEQNPITLKYKLETSEDNIVISGRTDAMGNAYVTYVEPASSDFGLYLYAIDSVDKYTFLTDEISTEESATPYDFTLTQPGNRFAPTDVYSSQVLTAEQSSITVSVKGALDDGGNGGASISKTSISAKWYYQVQNGGYYHRSTLVPIEFQNPVPGTVFVTGDSDDDGRVTVVYLAPTWDADPYNTAYLYVSYMNGPAIFTYDLPTPDFLAGGTTSMMDLVAEYGGCSAVPSDFVTGMGISSKDVVYSVSCNVSGSAPGDVPSTLVVYYDYQDIPYSSVLRVPTDGLNADFKIPVKRGVSIYVEIAETEGFEFSHRTKMIGSVYDDHQTFESGSAKSYPKCARNTPVVVDTYTVNGLLGGDSITFQFHIADSDIVLVGTAVSNQVVMDIMGKAGNVIENMTVSGSSGVYIPSFSGNAIDASTISEKSIVTYASSDASPVPSVVNITDSQTLRIYVEGKLYGTLTTGASGIGKISIPDVPNVVYKYVKGEDEYTVAVQEITSGPFTGFLAFNLHGLADVDASVSVFVHIEYVSSASMDNNQPAVMTYIVTDPYVQEMRVGDNMKLTAPDLEGFRFSGWYIGATDVSDSHDRHICNATVLESYDGETLTAAYSPVPYEEPDKGIDSTTLVIGLVAIMIAILAFGYVIIQNRRY